MKNPILLVFLLLFASAICFSQVNIVTIDDVDLGIKKDGSSVRVLIINKSNFVIKQFREILEPEGFNIVSTANDGQAGVQEFKDLYPNVDIVILGFYFTDTTGIDILKSIMDYDKSAKVIMTTALATQYNVKQALSAGAKHILLKPFDKEGVLKRVVSVLYNLQ